MSENKKIATDENDAVDRLVADAPSAADDNGGSREPISPWFLAEFMAWIAVALAPFLTWVNGPSVSTDQFVVRTIFFALAAVTAVSLRVGKMIRSDCGTRISPAFFRPGGTPAPQKRKI